MIPKGQLATVIRIAILTIVVVLLPGTALAHAGHAHGPGSVSLGAPDRSHDHANHLNVWANPKSVVVAETMTAISRTAAPGICSNTCCTSGFSCCAPAMLSEAVNLPEYAHDPEVVRPGPPMRAASDPEALPEPPKSSSSSSR